MTARWRAMTLYVVPAVAWSLHLVVSYLLVPAACDSTTVPLHLTTTVLLAAALGSLVVGRRVPATAHRAHRQPVIGSTLGVLFAAAIALQGAANLLVDPCA